MQSGFFIFLLSFFAACWILVIGHQLELGVLNMARYPSWSGSLVMAYTGAGISVCAAALLLAVALDKK